MSHSWSRAQVDFRNEWGALVTAEGTNVVVDELGITFDAVGGEMDGSRFFFPAYLLLAVKVLSE